MFKNNISLEQINAFCVNTLMEHLNIQFCEIGKDFLIAKMEVTPQVHQPMGLLHGGASVALAESVGSAASALLLNPQLQVPVGIEINANHIKSIKNGLIYAKATPIHIGKSTHVWDIRITSEKDELISVARLTNKILTK